MSNKKTFGFTHRHTPLLRPKVISLQSYNFFLKNPNFCFADNTFTIDMSPFPAGHYILRIGNHVTQIVKQ